jgi:nucleotide-binding universal stress UspA family protein
MGAHGSGDLSAALLGSVSHAVLKASPVPVTFVRERAAETDVEAED